ncbi:hypothetical protein [Pseudoalteromonas phenolica]|uniref:hypothetical protein n=1 Tax=Pseudoalteromonas phenolica TaxID=161398 RepID=UPI00110C05AE|nr:hypothetical protein [Pseudoalteromonas phenolica]TMO57104.1 hypothetical protein CWC21_04250 [Pseudoalteromonas phenolica]
MILKTIISKISGDKRWLKQWSEEDKKAELWNDVADLIEHMLDSEVDPSRVRLTFTAGSSGYTVLEPGKSTMDKNLIASIELSNYPEFIDFAPKLAEYTSREEEEKYTMPIINDIFKQVYG